MPKPSIDPSGTYVSSNAARVYSAAGGLQSVVVGGVLAGGVSTYDSIGSSLGAVFTHDIYRRFLAPGRSDAHYLFITRWATLGMIAVSFGYIPFLGGGMVALYLRLTGVAVVPLCTVYLMGSLTRVPRRARAIGLGVGVLYGISSLLDEWVCQGATLDHTAAAARALLVATMAAATYLLW